jgi:hypothetical protein
MNRIKVFCNLATTYNFDLNSLKTLWLYDDDEAWVNDVGSFPTDIHDFKDDYENKEEE